MKTVILGKGGLFAAIREKLQPREYLGFLDDSSLSDADCLGRFSDLRLTEAERVFIAFGSIANMHLRGHLLDRLSRMNLLHGVVVSDGAVVSPTATIGAGSGVCGNCSVGSNVEVGIGAILFSNVSIEHDSQLGQNVNIAPGVTISGSVKVGDNVFIGSGSIIADGVSIGSNSVIGAGALVLQDVEPYCIYFGAPARRIRTNDLYESRDCPF